MKWTSHGRASFDWLLLVVGLFVAACETKATPPGLGSDYGAGPIAVCIDHDGDGFGLNCAAGNDCDDENAALTNACYICAHDTPGCPCTTEAAQLDCGKVTAKLGGQTTCAYGVSVCSGGKWGECIPDGKTVRSFHSSRGTLGLANATACSANDCDPYCKQFPDTPDGTLSKPGLVGSPEAGLTLAAQDGGAPRAPLPNGPMPDDIRAALVDGGLANDAQPAIYHELPPAAEATDSVTGTTTGSKIDVYYLWGSTGSVPAAANKMSEEVAGTPPEGVPNAISQVQAVLPDTQFGAGHYGQYDQAPYKDVSGPTSVYEHIRSMTPLVGPIDSAFDWATEHDYESTPYPHSWAPALYGLSTVAGMPAASGYWVLPRSSWASPDGLESGDCPPGRVGYPCFRADAVPVTVLLADAPSANGPGGAFAYPRDDASGIAGGRKWSTVTPIAVTGNDTEANAREIDPSVFAVYTGDTSTGLANQDWRGTDTTGCFGGRGFIARNVFFKFHVDARTWFHFDTNGSSFRSVPFLYRSDGTYIACDEYDSFTDSPFNRPVGIDGVVDPGDYFLVVDGSDGDEGNYVLHVNAMPDGASAGAVAEPNYDEAIAAYRAIGGRFIGIDTSGYGCGSWYPLWLQRHTATALEKVSRDTGSMNATGNPYLISLQVDGDVCSSTDAPAATQIANAILDVAAARANITAVAIDADDAYDFDGMGGSQTLTAMNIDDATFVSSITTTTTAETTAKCQQTQPKQFVGCVPGTTATFAVTFKTPAAVTSQPEDQIFSFVIRLLRDGVTVISEIPVVIVVPGFTPVVYADARFIRDYDGSAACPTGTAPVWGLWAWNASTPGDSRIDFFVSVASSIAGLPAAPKQELLFSDPPGPVALENQLIGVKNGTPNTQAGATLVDATLRTLMPAKSGAALRMEAHLVPSTDFTLAPSLKVWNLQVSCRPSE
ncbi:MAG TPA: hypothetical protein VJT73_01260 [Polyangiaceae bacterium]|nr:hypothetical protein [Polyangiaceae bacterium]